MKTLLERNLIILVEKNVKVGIYLEQGKIVYQNNGFKIIEYPTERYKNHKELNDDNIYHIKVNGENRPTFDDICEGVYYLLTNKNYEGAFMGYRNKVYSAINRAEKDREKRLREKDRKLSEWK